MNYFELYPGDYLRDTSRLNLTEHGAYFRLMLAYYSEEEPLPADYDELFQITSAVRASDKAAVRKVADRFFPIGDDGLRRHDRIEKDIEKARKRIETSRRNGAGSGQKKNPVGSQEGGPEVGLDDTQQPPQQVTQQVTQQPPCSGEALHQTPHAIQTITTEASSRGLGGHQTAAGRACLLMRQAGCTTTNPSHPRLLEALDQGVTPEALGDTAREALSGPQPKEKPFAWAITTALSRHLEAQQRSNQPQEKSHDRSQPGRNLSTVERVKAANERAEQRRQGAAIDGEFSALA